MKLEGSYKLNLTKEEVWKALNDPNILKQCIPGCESFVMEGSNIFNATATNQIGPMNATFSGTVSLSNIKENESYTLSGEGHSSVGFANGTADIKLTEENGITILSYEVNVNVGGKIAQLGSRLINGVAKKMKLLPSDLNMENPHPHILNQQQWSEKYHKLNPECTYNHNH